MGIHVVDDRAIRRDLDTDPQRIDARENGIEQAAYGRIVARALILDDAGAVHNCSELEL
ncbi:hypothetical protein I6F35_28285 [Bradyrhizobium sp. BRP22]|uniref:hypothetical protein n=1 Tax=Bradyrhizobium sp. BRP22 TaxID=2793821 RepID=UPI0031FCA4A0|nr:hypothetical protein [Bradyrhizobium sp. BRP22]